MIALLLAQAILTLPPVPPEVAAGEMTGAGPSRPCPIENMKPDNTCWLNLARPDASVSLAYEPSGAIVLLAPPCGTVEATRWKVCIRWVVKTDDGLLPPASAEFPKWP